jgi:hypothetical protein
VTDEYRPLAQFTGAILKIGVDLKPDLTRDVEQQTTAHLKHTMLRE